MESIGKPLLIIVMMVALIALIAVAMKRVVVQTKEVGNAGRYVRNTLVLAGLLIATPPVMGLIPMSSDTDFHWRNWSIKMMNTGGLIR